MIHFASIQSELSGQLGPAWRQQNLNCKSLCVQLPSTSSATFTGQFQIASQPASHSLTPNLAYAPSSTTSLFRAHSTGPVATSRSKKALLRLALLRLEAKLGFETKDPLKVRRLLNSSLPAHEPSVQCPVSVMAVLLVAGPMSSATYSWPVRSGHLCSWSPFQFTTREHASRPALTGTTMSRSLLVVVVVILFACCNFPG